VDTREGNDDLKRLFAATDYAMMLPGGHYRNQTWGDSTRGVLLCIGIYGQTIFVDRSTDVVIVELSTHPEPVDDMIFGDTFQAINKLSVSL